jgi:bacterioferritin
MQGDPKVIDLLNQILSVELTAVHQYMLHARMCENWGYERLWKKIHEESLEELGHADRVIERILYLEGAPDVQRMNAVTPGASVQEQLRVDLELERGAVVAMNDGIRRCRAAGDNGSAELLEDLLEDTEEHVHWLESQLTLMDQVGVAGYLAEQLKGDG